MGLEKKKRKRCRANRDKVRARRVCEHCGKRTGPFEVHHIIPRSQYGGDEMENLACVCGGPEGCHRKITEHVIEFERRFKPLDCMESIDEAWVNLQELLAQEEQSE